MHVFTPDNNNNMQNLYSALYNLQKITLRRLTKTITCQNTKLVFTGRLYVTPYFVVRLTVPPTEISGTSLGDNQVPLKDLYAQTWIFYCGLQNYSVLFIDVPSVYLECHIR